MMSEAEQDRNVSKWREIPHHTHPSVIPFFCPIKSKFLIKVNFVDLNTAEELTKMVLRPYIFVKEHVLKVQRKLFHVLKEGQIKDRCS